MCVSDFLYKRNFRFEIFFIPLIIQGDIIINIHKFHADGQTRSDGRTERHNEAEGCFSQFCERAYNLTRTVSECVPIDSITFKLNP